MEKVFASTIQDNKDYNTGSLNSVASLATIESLSTDQESRTTSSTVVEKWWSTTLQVAIPFFLAGLGTIGAGLTLGIVTEWDVFKQLPALFVLIPSLLGLKGNLDMCLASRLSTQAHMGNMESWREIGSLILGNVAVVQVQATVAALIVAIYAAGMSALMHGGFTLHGALLLIASSLTTASSSCLILDIVMSGVVIASHRRHMNPDNMATPVAASIGDVVSISLLAISASRFFIIQGRNNWALMVIVGLYALLLPVWIFIALRNKYTAPVLTTGWIPVLTALLISGLGGVVLGNVVDKYTGFVVFQPIISGIGGNLVSVQASRISTMLHQTSLPGIVPPHSRICITPWAALISGVPHASTARILLCMNLVGQTMFLFAADYFHWQRLTVTAAFVLTYLTVCMIQVSLLLYIAHLIIHLMWRRNVDPDNSAIPYLTAIGDVLGSSLLALAFFLLETAHVDYSS